eukprot:COSAG01_NODE_27607_length_681_cov_1.546392_2_plen_36_part_01
MVWYLGFCKGSIDMKMIQLLLNAGADINHHGRPIVF